MPVALAIFFHAGAGSGAGDENKPQSKQEDYFFHKSCFNRDSITGLVRWIR